MRKPETGHSLASVLSRHHRVMTARHLHGGTAAVVTSCRRRCADGHRDDKEDAEDSQEKADCLESVSSARPPLDRNSHAAGPFSIELGGLARRHVKLPSEGLSLWASAQRRTPSGDTIRTPYAPAAALRA